MKNPGRAGLLIGAISVVLAFAGIFWYIGFTDNTALLKCIPKNANLVVKFDLKSIGENAHFEDWADMELFDELRNSTGDEEQTMYSIIKSPESSGINFYNNAYIASNSDSGENEMFMVLGMSDREEFEETLKRMDENIKIERNEVLNLVNTGYRDYIVFNDDVILVYFNSSWSKDEAEDRAKRFLTMDKEESILENDNFMDAESLGGDVLLYLNISQIHEFTRGLISNNDDVFAKLKSQSEALAMRLTLEDSQIKIESKNYYTEEYQNKLDDEEGEEVFMSKEDIAYISPKDPIAFGSFVMTATEMETNLQSYIELFAKSNITVDEILASFNGKISGSWIELSRQMVLREEVDYANWDVFSSAEPPMRIDTAYEILPIYKINLGVKDAYAADQLVKKIFNDESNPLQNGAGTTRIFGKLMPIFIHSDEKYVSISNSSYTFDLATPESVAKWEEDISTNKYMAYMDLKPAKFESVTQDEPRMMKEVLPYWNMFDYMVIRGDASNVTNEIVLTNSDDSFLWRIMQEINKRYKESKSEGVNS